MRCAYTEGNPPDNFSRRDGVCGYRLPEKETAMTTHEHLQTKFAPRLCPVCNEPIDLRVSKTDEQGRAIHEDCYALKIDVERATGAQGSFDQGKP